MPSPFGSLRGNGKISPTHDRSDSGSDQTDNHDENFKGTMNDNFQPVDARLMKGENKKDVKEKQQTNRKLKLFEIHRYADCWDILLMIVGTLSALATGVSMPIMMWLFQRVINSLVDIGKGATSANYTTSTNCYVDPGGSSNPYDTINGIIKWYAVIGASSIVAFWIGYAAWMTASERQVRRIRYALFGNILRQEIGWFDCRTAGELSSRLVRDLDNIGRGIGFSVGDFISLVSRIIASLIFSFYTGWKLTLVFLSVSPLIFFSFFLLIKTLLTFTELESSAYGKANSVVQEVLGAIRTVTAFSGQTKEVQRYKENLVEGKSIGMKKALMLGLTQGFTNIALYGGISIIFWYGPYLIRNECINYTAGHWMVIFILCLTSTFSLVTLMPNIQAFAEGAASGALVFDMIDRESKINIFKNDGVVPSNLVGDIEFRNIHFTYPSRKEAPILNGLSMKIPSGKTIALCGPSGCGKSTAIQLIQRFYDPDQGEVLLDGQNLRNINLTWLRSNIGIVSQEPVLFFGSIEDNIRFGKQDATDEEVQAAAKMANAHEFIMQLPQNYKTSSGDKLSGGQKQRVAIARALISNPRILLLDEATSALDNQGEKIVQEALDKAKEGRTTIVIAHRLSTIKNADIIVGIEKGQVVEYGTHNELMQRKGLYYELVTAQSENEKSKTRDDDSDTDELPKIHTSHNQASEKNHSKHANTSMIALRRASLISTKSITSQVSDLPFDDIHEDKSSKNSCCSTPFMFKVLKLNAPEWLYLVIGAFASLVFGAVMPAFSLLFSEIFRVLAEKDLQKQEDEVRIYTICVFLVGVGGAVSQFFSSLALGKAGEELTLRMRILSFQSMLRQEIGWFDLDENNLGALVTRLSTDAAALKGITGPTLSAILTAVGALVTALVISFIAGWKLTLVVLCYTPFMVFSGIIQGKQIAGDSNEKKGTSAAEDGGKHATQAIENIRTVVSLHQEQHFVNLYEKAFNMDFRRRLVGLHYIAFGNSLANSLMFFIHAGAFGYGVELVKSKEMSFNDVFKVFSVITFAAMSVGRSASMAPNFTEGKASAERIFLLNGRETKIDPEDESGITLSAVNGDIEFRDVKFRYPARPKLPILRRLNVRCESSATTALVGPSGSGKSTTVALILRFYDPRSGSVLLDGHDVRTLNIRWLRSLLGLVQQEPTLFNLSIMENIAYGDNTRQPTQAEIEAAARKANIHDTIINLPDGYNTICGAKGGQLSGGQKQRIAIARALIRNPKILLLDEATSALDNKSERIVQDALDQARAGRTCLTIAHRLSTIRNSEKICVVDRGRIKESGRHDQLLQQHGVYYKLHLAQERPDGGKSK